MRKQVLLAIVVAVAAARAVIAQCVQSQGYTPGAAATIGIKAGTGWAANGKPSPPISSAVGMWMNTCPDSGSGFAQLIANGNGEFNVIVQYYASAMPSQSNQPAGSCARFQPSLDANDRVDGGTIEIYAQATNGADCLWLLPHATLDNVIAHEIGHVLGLANAGSGCTSYLMGPNYPNVGVNAQECAWVAENWTTEAEQQQEACEANCPYPCTGTPPVCDTSIDTGGGYQCPFSQCSPLVLDLNGDGIHTTGVEDPVSFDLTGDGVPERLAWTDPATEEAFLWLDLHPNGRVDDGSELFGHGTLLENGRNATDGFEALAQYDRALLGGNGDGRISAADRVWHRLRLWVDSNHDGVCTAAESDPIAAYGVVEIPLTYTVHEEVDPSGNVHRLRGSYVRVVRGDGRPRLQRFVLHDVFFRSLPPE